MRSFYFVIALLVVLPAIDDAAVFDCDFVFIKVMKVKGIYKCKAQNFIIESEKEQITEIRGDHKEEKETKDVEIFVIENQVCPFLPKDLNLHMPKVYHFDVRNSGLKVITGGNMKMFPNLRQLYIRNNLIEVVPEGLFQFNPLLEFIDLSDNRIRNVGETVFNSLSNLKILIIERNVCVDSFAFQEEALEEMKTTIAKNCTLA